MLRGVSLLIDGESYRRQLHFGRVVADTGVLGFRTCDFTGRFDWVRTFPVQRVGADVAGVLEGCLLQPDHAHRDGWTPYQIAHWMDGSAMPLEPLAVGGAFVAGHLHGDVAVRAKPSDNSNE